jgi:hypothetical protein
VDAARLAGIATGTGKHLEAILAGIEDIGSTEPTSASWRRRTSTLTKPAGRATLPRNVRRTRLSAHELGKYHMDDPSALWATTEQAVSDKLDCYLEPEPVAKDGLRGLTDGDVFDLGSRTLDLVHAPGHAYNQMSFTTRTSP